MSNQIGLEETYPTFEIPENKVHKETWFQKQKKRWKKRFKYLTSEELWSDRIAPVVMVVSGILAFVVGCIGIVLLLVAL